MIDRSFIEAIADLERGRAEPEALTLHDYPYVFDPAGGLKERREPEPSGFTAATLTGVLDYIESNRDDLDMSKIIVNVESYRRVSVQSAVTGPYRQRFSYVVAEAHDAWAASRTEGQMMSPTRLIIAMQTLVEDSEERTRLTQIVGNVTDEQIRTSKDDGMTQEVAVRGAASTLVEAEGVRVENPFILSPFCTFPEINQPDVTFVVRFERGPLAGIFEAEGGAWKQETVREIVDHLKGSLPEGIAVVG